MKEVGFLWNRTVVEVVDKLSSTSIDFIRSGRELKKTVLIWSLNMLTGDAQSMLGGVKRENPKGKGKLGNKIITATIKIN